MAASETLIDLAKTLSSDNDTQNAGVLTKQDVINLVNTRVSELLAAISAVDNKVAAPTAASVTGLDAAIEDFVAGMLTAGAGITLTPNPSGHTLGVAATGTVSSVALALPNIFTVTGSPVTAAGTLTAVLAAQTANLVLAGPTTGASATPTFRTLVAADLPTSAATKGGTGQTGYAVGDILYAATTTTLSRLPAGTLNQALVVSATGIPEWGNHIGADIEDVILREDWINGLPAGQLGWSSSNNGTGSAVACNGTRVTSQHWGTVDLVTGTTNTGRAAAFLGTTGILLGGALCELEWELCLDTLSDGTNSYEVRVGLLDADNGTPVDGVYFVYKHGTSANWLARCSSNSSATELATTVPVVATNYQSFNIAVNAAGNEAKFYINGVLAQTITTNIPVGVGRLCAPHAHIIKTAGTVSRTLTADYFWLHGHIGSRGV
jgi:hypothetical protein